MKNITPTNSFNPDRVLLLCRRHIELNRKTWLIGFAAALGILALIWFYPTLTPGRPWHSFQTGNLLTPAIFLYTAGGLFLTSFLFDELHSPTTAFLNLTLPATAFEKLLSAWLVSSVIFTLVSVSLYTLFILLVQVMTRFLVTPDLSLQYFSQLDLSLLKSIFSYFTYNSFFLLGAIYFKKNNFLKTLLAMILISSGLVILSGILLFLFSESVSIQISLSNLETGTLYSIYLAVIVISLGITYIRLKNRQVV